MVKWTSEVEGSSLCTIGQTAPEFPSEFVVQTEASDVGLGTILSQVRDGEEHPLVYLSRMLK